MLDACIALLPHNEKTARAKVPGFERQSILGHKVKGVAVVMPEPRTQERQRHRRSGLERGRERRRDAEQGPWFGAGSDVGAAAAPEPMAKLKR